MNSIVEITKVLEVKVVVTVPINDWQLLTTSKVTNCDLLSRQVHMIQDGKNCDSIREVLETLNYKICFIQKQFDMSKYFLSETTESRNGNRM